MFTGIVTAIGTVLSVTDRGDRILRIGADWDCAALDIGASISHSGICLTVLSKEANSYEVAASAETMRVTTLGGWVEGSTVNLERALCVGDELGGHIVSGHVDGLAEVVSITPEGDSHGSGFARRMIWPDSLRRRGLCAARRGFIDRQRR